MDLQTRIIDGTIAAVTSRKLPKIALNALLNAALISLLYYVVTHAFDWVVGVAAIAGGLIYTVVRDFATRRQVKAELAAHLAYMRAKHPQLELYVPMLEKIGSTVLLKRAGLFLEDGELALEAYNQPAFAKTPKDSITVPCGADFALYEATPVANYALVAFRAELMHNPYRFHVLQDDETVARLAAFAVKPVPAETAETLQGKE